MTTSRSTGPSSPFPLPAYASDEPPLYSCPLRGSEQRLQETPRVTLSRRIPSSTYVKQAGNITVNLFNQYEGAVVPTYGCSAVINGAITLAESDGVIEVVMKVSIH